MGKLEKELDELMQVIGSGGGFGAPEAERDYERQIEHLRFKISRRDNIKIAAMSAVIGSISAALITLLLKIIGG